MTNIRRHPHPTVKVTDLLTSLEKIRGGFLKNFKTFNDLPESEDLRFDFSRYGWDLANYLTSDVLPTPLTIGLNGEWGSGKTTMIKAVQKNIDEINAENGGGAHVHTEYLEFNAWEAEKTDVVLSLYEKISCIKCSDSKRRKSSKKFAKSLAVLFADMALRRYGRITYEDAKKHIDRQITSKTISNQVSEIIGKRLVVFIDDLDRCDASNILGLLETIKNILNIQNLVFLITVDIQKIERAWELRYNTGAGGLEGQEHIEKLFPVIFSLPSKSDDEVGSYVDHLVRLDDEYGKLRTHLAKSLTNNPRKIKRMLNLTFFIIQNYDLRDIDVSEESNLTQESQLHFAFVITWVSLTTNHRKISKLLQLQPSAIIPLAVFFSKINHLSSLKVHHPMLEDGEGIPLTYEGTNYEFDARLFDPPVKDILDIVVREDGLAFKTIKQVGRFLDEFKPDPESQEIVYRPEDLYRHYDRHYKIFKRITERGGLIGT